MSTHGVNGTALALRHLDRADLGSKIEDRPIDLSRPFSSNNGARCGLQTGIVTNICEPSRPKQSFKHPGHIHV
jgi:hypothetical protein